MISLRPNSPATSRIFSLKRLLTLGFMNENYCFASSSGHPVRVKNLSSSCWPGSLARPSFETM